MTATYYTYYLMGADSFHSDANPNCSLLGLPDDATLNVYRKVTCKLLMQ